MPIPSGDQPRQVARTAAFGDDGPVSEFRVRWRRSSGSSDPGAHLAKKPRATRLVKRFKINKGEPGQVQGPFLQNNGGTFTFSTGTEGIIFSLSDSDLLDLVRGKKNWRIVLAEEPK